MDRVFEPTLPGRNAALATAAHNDGRHESTHPEDKRFWVRQGCAGCATTHDERGMRR